MMKLILFISVLLIASAQYAELETIIADTFESFSIKKMMEKIVADEKVTSQMNSECFDTLQMYVNNFQTYSTELALMTAYSGRDINDLGRFTDCNALDFTRYVSLSVSGLPIGIYLGICGPKECQEEDFEPLSAQLAVFAFAIVDQLPDAESFNVEWTADNFRFVDSLKANAKNTEISPGFIFAV